MSAEITMDNNSLRTWSAGGSFEPEADLGQVPRQEPHNTGTHDMDNQRTHLNPHAAELGSSPLSPSHSLSHEAVLRENPQEAASDSNSSLQTTRQLMLQRALQQVSSVFKPYSVAYYCRHICFKFRVWIAFNSLIWCMHSCLPVDGSNIPICSCVQNYLNWGYFTHLNPFYLLHSTWSSIIDQCVHVAQQPSFTLALSCELLPCAVGYQFNIALIIQIITHIHCQCCCTVQLLNQDHYLLY